MVFLFFGVTEGPFMPPGLFSVFWPFLIMPLITFTRSPVSVTILWWLYRLYQLRLFSLLKLFYSARVFNTNVTRWTFIRILVATSLQDFSQFSSRSPQCCSFAVSQNPREFYASHSPGRTLVYIYSQISISCTIPSGTPFLPIVPSLLCEFATFAYYVINGFLSFSTQHLLAIPPGKFFVPALASLSQVSERRWV